jgi:CheY-like chemotaxis protein
MRGCAPLIDAVGPCVLVLNRAARCIFANRSCAETLGHADARALLGQRMSGRIAEAVAQRRAAHLLDEPMQRADSREVLVECWVRPLGHGPIAPGTVVSFVERESSGVRWRWDAPGALDGKSALVVENEEDARTIVTAILEQHGAHVRAVESVAEAMQVLQAFLPDILVSDINMPVEDGYTLVRRLRASQDPRWSRLPAIALTALARPEDRAKALDAGFEIHLVKPVDPEDLVRAVSHLASSGRRTRSGAD